VDRRVTNAFLVEFPTDWARQFGALYKRTTGECAKNHRAAQEYRQQEKSGQSQGTFEHQS
jgi:hypothetical protein